ncbi:MAG: hypothetical protein ACOCYW_03445 [Roseicyclus sp.]
MLDVTDRLDAAGPVHGPVIPAGMARHGPALHRVERDVDTETGVNAKAAIFLA